MKLLHHFCIFFFFILKVLLSYSTAVWSTKRRQQMEIEHSSGRLTFSLRVGRSDSVSFRQCWTDFGESSITHTGSVTWLSVLEETQHSHTLQWTESLSVMEGLAWSLSLCHCFSHCSGALSGHSSELSGKNDKYTLATTERKSIFGLFTHSQCFCPLTLLFIWAGTSSLSSTLVFLNNIIIYLIV